MGQHRKKQFVNLSAENSIDLRDLTAPFSLLILCAQHALLALSSYSDYLSPFHHI